MSLVQFPGSVLAHCRSVHDHIDGALKDGVGFKVDSDDGVAPQAVRFLSSLRHQLSTAVGGELGQGLQLAAT